MFDILKSIKLPFNTKIITCLTILAIVLVILYFTGFINKEKLPFENYEDAPKKDLTIGERIGGAFDALVN